MPIFLNLPVVKFNETKVTKVCCFAIIAVGISNTRVFVIENDSVNHYYLERGNNFLSYSWG